MPSSLTPIFEQIVSTYLATPEGRQKLLASIHTTLPKIEHLATPEQYEAFFQMREVLQQIRDLTGPDDTYDLAMFDLCARASGLS